MCVCRPHVVLVKLSRNTKVVAEALARVIYNLTEKVNAEVRSTHHHTDYHFNTGNPHVSRFDRLLLLLFPPRVSPRTSRSSLSRW